MFKTPITVLQELMVKFSERPEYEYVAQSGPQHRAVFEYRCSAHGHVVTATARSKKEAKQEAARLILARLAAAGLAVPPASAAPPRAADGDAVAAGSPSKTYKELLNELCQKYKLPGPEYTLEGNTGPAHAQRFTVRGAVGAHARIATANTKKAAQQLAAQQLYQYLRENLARLTHDFLEGDAPVRAHGRAMETRDPAQRVDDYHLGLLQHTEEDKLRACCEVLAAAGEDPETTLAAAVGALGLRAEWHALPAMRGHLELVRLAPTSPPLVYAGYTRAEAATDAIADLRDTMLFRNISSD